MFAEYGAGRAVSEIAKELGKSEDYAHRVQLAEGRATENVGVGGVNALPFTMIVQKMYPNKEAAEAACDDSC